MLLPFCPDSAARVDFLLQVMNDMTRPARTHKRIITVIELGRSASRTNTITRPDKLGRAAASRAESEVYSTN